MCVIRLAKVLVRERESEGTTRPVRSTTDGTSGDPTGNKMVAVLSLSLFSVSQKKEEETERKGQEGDRKKAPSGRMGKPHRKWVQGGGSAASQNIYINI